MSWTNWFSKKLSIFHILGIPVTLDYSWFIIFFVYSWTIAVVYLPNNAPQVTKLSSWMLGIATSLLVFVSVLLHELGHSVVAQKEGIKIQGITLHIFGGLAYLESEPKNALAELKIAIAGPVASFLLSGIFYLLTLILLKTPYKALDQAFLHLSQVNFLLACFNLLPAFPMDGGRVLRAILWYFDKSYEKATRLTIVFGFVFSVALVAVGIVNLLGGYNTIIGFWALLGGFLIVRLLNQLPPDLITTPGKKTRQSKIKQKPVKEAMTRKFTSIRPIMTIKEVMSIYEKTPAKTFLVLQDERLHGVLFMTDIEKLTELEQTNTVVSKLMRVVSQEYFVTQDLSIQEAIKLLNNNKLEHLAVIDSDSLVVGALSLREIYLTKLG